MKVLRLYGKIFEEEDYPNPLKSKSFNKETEKRPSKIISDISLHQMIRMPSNPFAAEIRKYDSKYALLFLGFKLTLYFILQRVLFSLFCQ